MKIPPPPNCRAGYAPVPSSVANKMCGEVGDCEVPVVILAADLNKAKLLPAKMEQSINESKQSLWLSVWLHMSNAIS